jgi:hypothetical protein
MNVRSLALSLAAIAAVSPAISQASTEKAALDACARAFASSLASPGAAVPVYTVVYGGIRNTGSISEFFAREFTFELHADSKKTGLAVARASCSVDSRGTVVALSPIPMEAAQPALAAR